MAFAKRCPPPLLRPPARCSAAGSNMSGSMISPRPTRPTSRLSTRGGATSAAGGTAMVALSSLTRPSLNALETYEPVAFELGGERTRMCTCELALGLMPLRTRPSSNADELERARGVRAHVHGRVRARLRTNSDVCELELGRMLLRVRPISNALETYVRAHVHGCVGPGAPSKSALFPEW